jgi:hypothetical protein
MHSRVQRTWSGHLRNDAACQNFWRPGDIADGATTSGCSRRQKFICILKRKPLSTAAIKASARQHGDTEEPRQKESVIRNRHEPETALPPQRTRALREGHRHAPNASRLSLTATEIAAAQPALLPHRRNLQYRTQNRIKVMQEVHRIRVCRP